MSATRGFLPRKIDRRAGARSGPATAADADPFWAVSIQHLQETLGCDDGGLSGEEAARRLDLYGRNEPGRPPWWLGTVLTLRRIVNPLAIILLLASAVSVVVGEIVSAGIIVCIVLLSASVDLFQTRRSHQAAERLRQRVEVQATVLRDAKWIDVSLREIVPGDRIRLSAGDIVPADARIVKANALYLDEAAFTGESLPVEKAQSDAGNNAAASAATDAAFMGTIVTGGSGEALVARTGDATTYAGIAARLQAAVPRTAFDRGLSSFSTLIARTVTALVVFVLVVNLVARRDPLESLLFAVALAVGLTPEFLPMIMTVTQAEGAMRMARSKVIVRQLAAIQNFGSLDVLCSDKTGTLTAGRMGVNRAVDALGDADPTVLAWAYLNAAGQTGLHSPFDEAIVAARPPDAPDTQPVGEIPFDFERRRVSVAVEVDGRRVLVTKGAPESVLQVCTRLASSGQETDLGANERTRVDTLVSDLGEQGFRLLAIATRPLDAQDKLDRSAECGMAFRGLVAFSDPPKEGVADVIDALHADGIRLKIISGDAEAVIRHICGSIGFACDRVLSGDDLDRMDDTALCHAVQECDVYARVAPEQKLRIIHALQQAGHVVGYLGDGINDAPSLRAADVGISVAEAVDVARDAASVVLLEKSLAVLHQGVMEGRKSFGNVMKYIMMGTSSNFGNMLSMAGAVLFLPFLPMLPPQVLLNNWLYDLSQMSIPVDRVDEALVRKPRHWDTRFIRDFMLIFGPISSLYDFLTFFALRHFFHAGPVLFHTGWFVESLATQTLVVFVIRTAGNPLRSRPSWWLVGTVAASVAVAVLLPWTPLAGALGFTAPPFGFMLFVIGAVVTYLLLVEVVKRVFYHYHGIGTDTVSMNYDPPCPSRPAHRRG